MRAARIVYTLIGVFILLPWVVYNAKSIYSAARVVKSKSLVTRRLIIFALVSVLIITAVFAHYNFTIGYQAPLVAERAGILFTQRIAGQMDLPGYINKMVDSGIGKEDMVTVSGEDLEMAGFESQYYNLFLSEKTYALDDGSAIIYFKHDDSGTSNYSYVRMRKEGYKWMVVEHNVLTHEQFEEINNKSKIRFYQINP